MIGYDWRYWGQREGQKNKDRNMHKVTERHLEAAQEVLERNRMWLYTRGNLDTAFMAKELRNCWGIGDDAIAPMILDLFTSHARYRYLAAYYMQHAGGPGVAAEFKRSLAELYELRYYNASEQDGFGKYGKQYWETFTSEEARKLRFQIDELREGWERLDANCSQERRNRMRLSIERLQRSLSHLTGEAY